MKRIVLGCLILFVSVSSNAQTFECPDWALSRWWDVDSTYEALFSGDLPAEITLQEIDCRQSVVSIQTKMLSHGEHTSHLVYVLQYEGLVYGSGTIYYDGGPFPLNFEVRIPDTTVQGEIWIDTQTLSLVRWSRMLIGRIETQQGSSWEDIGEISFSASTEYDPKWDQYTFPLAVGDDWNGTSVIYFFGDYRIALEMFSPDVVEEKVFDAVRIDEYSATAAEMEDIQGISALRIEQEFDSGAESTIWYAPVLGWNKRFDQSGITFDSVFNLATIQYETGEFGDTPATPQPTRTPVPSTVTPTAPPTQPPTPTPTGTQPTPTPTYTLPPWIPRTPTPTPPSSATTTPSPPNDTVSIRINTNLDVFSEGDPFRLTTTLTNPLDGMFVMQYIILEYQSHVWFWPSWTPDVNGQFRILPEASQYVDETILEFTCPRIESTIDSVRFWAVLTEPGTFEIVGEYDSCSIRFE